MKIFVDSANLLEIEEALGHLDLLFSLEVTDRDLIFRLWLPKRNMTAAVGQQSLAIG